MGLLEYVRSFTAPWGMRTACRTDKRIVAVVAQLFQDFWDARSRNVSAPAGGQDYLKAIQLAAFIENRMLSGQIMEEIGRDARSNASPEKIVRSAFLALAEAKARILAPGQVKMRALYRLASLEYLSIVQAYKEQQTFSGSPSTLMEALDCANLAEIKLAIESDTSLRAAVYAIGFGFLKAANLMARYPLP